MSLTYSSDRSLTSVRSDPICGHAGAIGMRKVQGPLNLISLRREARRTPVSRPLFLVTCPRLSRVREVVSTKIKMRTSWLTATCIQNHMAHVCGLSSRVEVEHEPDDRLLLSHRERIAFWSGLITRCDARTVQTCS
jgi:hypothetical protein